MSEKDRDEFWKELFGEDYDSGKGEREREKLFEESVPLEQGFTIERVSMDGTPIENDSIPDNDSESIPQNAQERETVLPAKSKPEREPQSTPKTENVPQSTTRAERVPQSTTRPENASPGTSKTEKVPHSTPKTERMSQDTSKFERVPRDTSISERTSRAASEPESVSENSPGINKAHRGAPEAVRGGSRTGEVPETRGPGDEGLRRTGERRRGSGDDFEVDFDFDSAYQDVDEKAVKRGRTKKTGCLGGIMLFLFVLCVSIVLAILGWMAAVDVLGLDGEDQQVEVTLSKSIFAPKEIEVEDEDGNITNETIDAADIDQVADILYEQGLIKYKWLFKIFSKFSKADEKVTAGTYQLNMNYDYRALVNGMTSSGGKKVEVEVTIPEGYSITQIVHLLSENNVCDEDALLDALANYDFDYDFLEGLPKGNPKRLEGFLFPDTYKFYMNDSPSRVIGKFLTNFQRKWTEEMDEELEELGRSMYEVLIVASMIEKEAGGESDRAKIASVIYNRLNNPDAHGTGGLLQIDATIYYAIADTGESFSTSVESPYNTYLYAGLTPTPISNPGLAAIEAALNPEDTNYYYYALGKDGLHQFFTTFEAQQAFVHSDDYGG